MRQKFCCMWYALLKYDNWNNKHQFRKQNSSFNLIKAEFKISLFIKTKLHLLSRYIRFTLKSDDPGHTPHIVRLSIRLLMLDKLWSNEVDGYDGTLSCLFYVRLGFRLGTSRAVIVVFIVAPVKNILTCCFYVNSVLRSVLRIR